MVDLSEADLEFERLGYKKSLNWFLQYVIYSNADFRIIFDLRRRRVIASDNEKALPLSVEELKAINIKVVELEW